MKTIEIDDELFGFLQSKAIPFVETPNLTLRRLLLPENKNQSAKPKLALPEKYQNSKRSPKKRKQPKTDLIKLTQSGLLREGQTLFLHDYQGDRISGYEAKISGKDLLWKNKKFSMSELAKNGLKEQGFSSDSVRGPAFWHNSDGISVKKLWEQYLKSR